MFSAIKNRRPWVAVIFGFLLPPIAMLYLNRGWLALAYLSGAIAISAAGSLQFGRVSANHLPLILDVCSLLLSVVAATQAYFIAKDWQADKPQCWFCRTWPWFAGGIFGLLCALLGIRTFLYQPFNVPSASMIPAVNVGDYFLASKSSYNFVDPSRGDVVVFRTDKFGGTYFFKRVIGLPGERVQLMHGTVFINGQALQRKRIDGRPHIPGLLLCDAAIICDAAEFVESLPSGISYNVLELERDGPSDNTEVFVVPANSYFVLGDNRDNSEDSRHDIGFVRRDHIVGRAAFLWFSANHWTWRAIR